jgi:LysM repeat protein
MRLPEWVADVRFVVMMEDFDDEVSSEEVSEGGNKTSAIAVIVALVGIVVGVTGIVLANKAQNEVRTLEARMTAKPDKTQDLRKTVASLDERLVKLGGEFVKLGRADRAIQENTQKAFTEVGSSIGENREAINGLTTKLTELVGNLENWKPTSFTRTTSTPTTSEPSGTTTPAVAPGTLTDDGIYTIQSGDTFSSVAKKMGVSLSQLIAANPTANPNSLQIGQKIVVPQQ